jgi:redox-sensitive bicupin YhaK (pirin superfamily)
VELTTVSERAENKDLPISVEYSADTLLVRSREGSRSLDLVLNVPPRTNLMLSTVRGPIKIDGQTAAISARTGQGDITVQLDEPHNADIKATATKGAVDLLVQGQGRFNWLLKQAR